MIKTSIKRFDPAKYEIKSFDPGQKKMTRQRDANLKINFRWPYIKGKQIITNIIFNRSRLSNQQIVALISAISTLILTAVQLLNMCATV